MTDAQGFRAWWDAGFRRLVPVMPPGVPVHENSTVYRRMQKTGKDPRGKAPGMRGRDGLWRGFPFVTHESSENDLPEWSEAGASVGVKLGRGLVLIDADTTDERLAAIIKVSIESSLGRLPVRVGQYPKAGYLARVDEDCGYMRVEFNPKTNGGGKLHNERVEILTEGRQFVAEGPHPSGSAYRWPGGMPVFDDVPVVSAKGLAKLLEDLAAVLPAAGKIVRDGPSGDREGVNQNALRGPLEAVRAAVAAIPNTSALFGERGDYTAVGYAIKAALPDNEGEALEIFQDWCARWIDDVNDPEIVEDDWRRMKPPYSRGASWLYELAEAHGGGAFNRASVWFDAEAATVAAENAADHRKRFLDVLSIDEIFDLPDPEFLIGRHVVEKSLGFLYGNPGTGKSFIALDWALSLAAGLGTWHGDALKPRSGVVVYLAGEGAPGFKARISAWCRQHGVERSAMRGKFWLVPIRLSFMDPDAVRQMIAAVQGRVGNAPVDLLAVDTVSRVLPGADENAQKEMTLFVDACSAVRDRLDCAVVGVHHSAKSGAMRGSTVLNGAGDFVFKLVREIGATVGRLTCEKQKDAPDGWSDSYRFTEIGRGEGVGGMPLSLVPVRVSASEAAADTAAGALTPDSTEQVLDAIAVAWASGDPWSLKAQARDRHAAHKIMDMFDVARSRANEMIETLLATGLIIEDVVSAHSKKKGLRTRRTAVLEEAEDAENDMFG